MKRSASDDEAEEEAEVEEKPSKSKKPAAAAAKDDKSSKKAKKAPTEDAVFNIGGTRKVTVGFFNGKVNINIREYYTDRASGQEKPGSKGIALTPEQWQSLTEQAEVISEAVYDRA